MTERKIPTELTAGLNFGLTIALADFPAPEWSLVLLLRGPKSLQVESVDAGTEHGLAANGATTAAWPAGDYIYSLRATNGGDVVEVEAGRLRIAADVAAMPEGTDTRSHARRALEAIEAVLERRSTLDQDRYTINNRELWRTPIPDLLKLKAHYRAEVAREEAVARGRSSLLGRTIRVTF